ncbi:DUF2971 domain-containing protein [Rhizobium leguminosarum]|uniref:DUF2971 domain-containing protein n=1 Tax=Rhizobium ruizarguesonis TaxID=2081791 RepID=UPI0013E03F91|nr:DUF2971 domain-containing protein [Rhizobium ruizarguesonis]NEJ95262.1 DUF2971 domain-containing protein [Rhizobium ruizarguesonis]QIJ40272.1 DUF2971 domain-containing protein [Rhizobium leguminosarum]
MAAEQDLNNGLEEQALPPSGISDAFSGLADQSVGEIYKGLEIPRTLFHYTSAQGLIGILGEHKIWFSDATFMNDGSETTWGINLVTVAIDQLIADKPAEEKDAGEALKIEVGRAMEALQPVIFCMSSRNNLLNQWRDYGKDVVPYSIEFDVQEFEKWGGKTFPIFLTKIVYNYSFQQKLIRDLLTSIYMKTIELRGSRQYFDEEEGQRLLRGAAVEIVSLITRFKNSSFDAEEEWRAICYRPQVANVVRKYRSSSLGVVPYYEWHATDEPKQLPIKSVTVGPSPYAQVSDLALKQFLADKGYDVPTHYSTIPIRR